MEGLKQIGKRCKRIREDYGITQDQMAIRNGVTRNTISRFELGESNNLLLYMDYLALDGGGVNEAGEQ